MLNKEIEKRLDNVEKLQQANSIAISLLTTNIAVLTSDVSNLANSTKGIVDVWSAGRTLQKVIKWFSGFSFIAIVIAYFSSKT